MCDFHRLAPLFITLTVGLIGAPSLAHADAPVRQPGNFGLGLGSGAETALGLSMKYFPSTSNSYQFTVGLGRGRWRDGRDDDDDWWYDGRRWRRDGRDFIGLGADYLWELAPLVQTSVIDIAFAVGLGAGLGIWDDGVGISACGVGGLEFMLNPIPIDFVVEWRPTLYILPNVAPNLVDFTGHVRIYF